MKCCPFFSSAGGNAPHFSRQNVGVPFNYEVWFNRPLSRGIAVLFFKYFEDWCNVWLLCGQKEGEMLFFFHKFISGMRLRRFCVKKRAECCPLLARKYRGNSMYELLGQSRRKCCPFVSSKTRGSVQLLKYGLTVKQGKRRPFVSVLFNSFLVQKEDEMLPIFQASFDLDL